MLLPSESSFCSHLNWSRYVLCLNYTSYRNPQEVLEFNKKLKGDLKHRRGRHRDNLVPRDIILRIITEDQESLCTCLMSAVEERIFTLQKLELYVSKQSQGILRKGFWFASGKAKRVEFPPPNTLYNYAYFKLNKMLIKPVLIFNCKIWIWVIVYTRLTRIMTWVVKLLHISKYRLTTEILNRSKISLEVWRIILQPKKSF